VCPSARWRRQPDTVVVSAEPIIHSRKRLPAAETVTAGCRCVVNNRRDGGARAASTNLTDLVRALNAVGATPIDMLAILQAMRVAGALKEGTGDHLINTSQLGPRWQSIRSAERPAHTRLKVRGLLEVAPVETLFLDMILRACVAP
jgi:hypothetical protein